MNGFDPTTKKGLRHFSLVWDWLGFAADDMKWEIPEKDVENTLSHFYIKAVAI